MTKRNWIYEYTVRGTTHEELQGQVLANWRTYQNNTEAELPWNTQVVVSVASTESTLDGKAVSTTYEAGVTVQWQE